MQSPLDRNGMLDDPGLSRQWILRRLQRALTLDRAGAALHRGIASTGRGPVAVAVARRAVHAEGRADALTEAIGRIGAVPYSSVGLARAVCRLGGAALGLLGARVWSPVVRRLGDHTLAEYESLAAFVNDAPGVPADLSTTVRPLVESIADERAEISGL